MASVREVMILVEPATSLGCMLLRITWPDGGTVAVPTFMSRLASLQLVSSN